MIYYDYINYSLIKTSSTNKNTFFKLLPSPKAITRKIAKPLSPILTNSFNFAESKNSDNKLLESEKSLVILPQSNKVENILKLKFLENQIDLKENHQLKLIKNSNNCDFDNSLTSNKSDCDQSLKTNTSLNLARRRNSDSNSGKSLNRSSLRGKFFFM